MFHQHDDALDTGHQVHGTTHAFDHLARNHPIGQVARRADLHGTEYGQIDFAAANHGKTVVAAEDG